MRYVTSLIEKIVLKFWKSRKIEKDNASNKKPRKNNSDVQNEADYATQLISEGLELSSQGKYDESELRFYSVTSIDPNFTAVWYDRALSNPQGIDALLFEAIAAEDKVKAYDDVLAIHPRNTRALMWKGLALDRLGRVDEGLTCYKKAIEINPRALWILTNAARVNRMVYNDHEEAIFILKAILRIKPDDPIMLEAMGWSLSALKREEEALTCYDKSLEIVPNNPNVLCDKGSSLYNIERVNEALHCFENALKIEPNHYTALTNRGVVLQEIGREKEALDSYDKALKIQPDYANALYNKARLKVFQEKNKESLELLQQAIEYDSNYKDLAKKASEFDKLRDERRFKKLVT